MTKLASERCYLAAYLPFLPAERRTGAGLAPPDAPFAVTEKQRGALRIVALSPAAAALGLAPGMMLADARARVPELGSFAHDPAADHALLDWLVAACERYTPMVASEGEAALVLDLTGCASFLGMDAAGVAADLSARLGKLGLSASIAGAATPRAALALARFGARYVEELPVAALDLEGDAEMALKRAGLRSIGDLASRPRAPLAARFGTVLSTRLAELLGEQDPRITPRRVPAPIRIDRRFAEPLATVAPLLDIVCQMAGEAEPLLAGRGKGGRRFELLLFRTDGHVARLAVDSGRAVRDPQAVAALFHERIESLADPLDPGFGYDMMRLNVPALEDVGEEQAILAEAGERQAPDLAALLDRLMVRFGAESISCFHLRDAYLPEYVAGFAPPDSKREEWPGPEAGEPPLRPLFLIDPPQRVNVIAEVPDGPPRRFGWRGKQHRVIRHEGPERIAYPWWKAPEGKGPTRDYYRVEDDSGHRFWLFRHGLYGREKPDPGWYLHGLFA